MMRTDIEDISKIQMELLEKVGTMYFYILDWIENTYILQKIIRMNLT